MFRRVTSLTTVILLLFVTIALAQPVMAKPSGDGPGNSANAKMCQKGGWQSLARSGSSGVAFANQDECVSFGAQGGVIVNHRSLFVEWKDAPLDSGYNCIGFLTFSGFEPGSYQVTVSWDGGGWFTINLEVENGEEYSIVWANSAFDPHTFTVEDLSITSTTDCSQAVHN